MTLQPTATERSRWRDAVDPGLSGRLRRMMVKPGVIGNHLSGSIIARARRMASCSGDAIALIESKKVADYIPPGSLNREHRQRTPRNDSLPANDDRGPLPGTANFSGRGIFRRQTAFFTARGGFPAQSAEGLAQRRAALKGLAPVPLHAGFRSLKTPDGSTVKFPKNTSKEPATAKSHPAAGKPANQDSSRVLEKPILQQRLQGPFRPTAMERLPAYSDRQGGKPVVKVASGTIQKPILQRRLQPSARPPERGLLNPGGQSSTKISKKVVHADKAPPPGANVTARRSTETGSPVSLRPVGPGVLPTTLNPVAGSSNFSGNQTNQAGIDGEYPLPLAIKPAKPIVSTAQRSMHPKTRPHRENQSGIPPTSSQADPGPVIQHRHLNMLFRHPIQRRQPPLGMVPAQEPIPLVTPALPRDPESVNSAYPAKKRIQQGFSPVPDHRNMLLARLPEHKIQRSNGTGFSKSQHHIPGSSRFDRPLISSAAVQGAMPIQTRPDVGTDRSSATRTSEGSVALPAVPAPENGPELDVMQLADQVYTILLNRLASERERRGL